MLSEMIRKAIKNPRLAILVLARYCRFLSDEVFIKTQFWANLHHKLNLDNPQTYNEKIQWIKLYDRNPRYTQLSDKYEVRKYIADKAGEQYLVPMFGIWDNVSDIVFDDLPNQFVLKCTHDCGSTVICRDKSQHDIKKTKRKLEKKLKQNFYLRSREWQYKDIKPRIIAEEYLENSTDELYDYKIWCFGGEPHCIQFLCDRKTRLKMAFYDTDWNLLPYVYNFERNTKKVSKPVNLDEMLQVAKTVSQGFSFVRVDLYSLNDGSVKFGEMTFTPISGVALWSPPEYDLAIGEMIKLPGSDED